MPVTGTKAAASAQGYGLFGPSGSPVDPNFNSVSLLLHGDGTNGAQNNTFLDSSANNFTITRSGSATQGAFSPFALSGSDYNPSTNGGSVYFDGSSYLTLGANPDISTGNFTIEGWFNPSATPTGYNCLFSRHDVSADYRGIILITETTGYLTLYVTTNGTSWTNSILTSTYIAGGAWTHIAVVRNGSVFTLYANGVSLGTTSTASAIYNVNQSWEIGTYANFPGGRRSFTGYVSNFRVVSGTAVYTSNFTPPTAPVTAISGTSLLCNFTNAGIFDNAAKNDLVTVGSAQVSSAQVKFGTGSMLFNGTTDYLNNPSNSNLELGFGSFTIEWWEYVSTNHQAGIISRSGTTGTNGGPWLIIGRTNGNIEFWAHDGTGGVWNISNGTILGVRTLGAWTHWALVRNGTVFKAYKNGVDTGISLSSSLSFASSSSPMIIGQYDGFFNGYIDDLRITKGVARYTSNFTPPTQAFPNR